MSPDPSPYRFWRGMILSLRNDAEAERRYVEGVLFALAQIAEAPDCADITPSQVAELEELRDRGTAEFGG